MTSRIFTVSGRVAFRDLDDAPGVYVAVVDADPDLDDLIGVGTTGSDGTFRLSFTEQAFNQEPSALAQLPDIYVVVSIVDDGTLVPVLRHAWDRQAFAKHRREADLGTITLPLRRGDKPLGVIGLRPAPGRGRIAKRLQLHSEIAWTAAREVAPIVERLTGWSGLLDRLHIEIVDDVGGLVRWQFARALERHDFDERELAILAAFARECDAVAYAEWDFSAGVLRLYPSVLEGQNLDFLKVAIGRALVHVGHSRARPDDDALLARYQSEIWKNVIAGKLTPREVVREQRGFKANLEGYATYIERCYLRRIYTHAEAIPRPTAAADAHFRRLLVLRTLPGDLAPETPEELMERVGGTKEALCVSGMAAYLARSDGDVPAPFDPELRPEVQLDMVAVLTELASRLSDDATEPDFEIANDGSVSGAGRRG